MRCRVFHVEEHTSRVYGHDTVEVFDRGFSDRYNIALDPCDVVSAVEHAELFYGASDIVSDGGVVADISNDREQPPRGGSYPVHGFCPPRLVAIDGNDFDVVLRA